MNLYRSATPAPGKYAIIAKADGTTAVIADNRLFTATVQNNAIVIIHRLTGDVLEYLPIPPRSVPVAAVVDGPMPLSVHTDGTPCYSGTCE